MTGNGGAQSIVRKALLRADLAPASMVARVDIRQIDFAPGQRTGRHLHPCPVVGYIVKGTAHLQIAGQPKETLGEGDAFYEPADTAILRFDNASERDPLTFIAFYLLGTGEHELIRMLE